LALQATAGHGQAVLADFPRRVAVTQVEPGPEQFSHPTRETHGPASRRRLHLVAPPQQVLQALLVVSVDEPVVGRPAVLDHGAVVIEAQDGLGHGAAAGRVDDVSGRLWPDQGVQPGRVSAHPPPRLVGHDPFRLAHGLADGLVDRLAARGGPQHGLNTAAATEGDAKEAFQAAGDLAVREPTLLVEFDDGGLGVGPQLSRGGTQGVGCLQGVAPLDPAAALAALADVDVELPVDGLARDLDLELLGDAGFFEGAAAVGADVGQGGLVDLVDLFGAGRLAVGLGAVLITGLTAGLLGLVLGLALGEGSGWRLPARVASSSWRRRRSFSACRS
jgi:hypothetical protein